MQRQESGEYKGRKVVNTKAGKWRIQRQESGEYKGRKVANTKVGKC